MKFIHGLFSEPDGKPSFTRVVLGTVIGFSLMWITVIVFEKGIMPEMGGVATLIGVAGTVTYGYNQAGVAVKAFAERPLQPEQPTQSMQPTQNVDIHT